MSRLLPQQSLLLNLKQELCPLHPAYMTREAAYEELKAFYKKGFGYDVRQWKSWIRTHFTIYDNPKPSLLKKLLLNLEQQIAPDASDYMSREEAYETLKHVTNQDYGYDVSIWQIWTKRKQKVVDWHPDTEDTASAGQTDRERTP